MKKLLILMFAASVLVLLQNCRAKKQVSIENEKKLKNNISYTRDLKPIMTRSCTPCHYPENGKKQMLHTYALTKEHIAEILIRVQLPKEELKYMPFKGKRPALTEAEIRLFKEWAYGEMAH